MTQSVLSNFSDEPRHPYLVVTHGGAIEAPSKQLPIQERINSLAIPAGARNVLTLICTMTEFGKDKCLWANNAKIGAQANCHPNSIPRHIALLEGAGLIVKAAKGLRRILTPSALLRGVYTTNTLNNLLSLNEILNLNNANVKPKQNVKEGKQNVKHNLKLELKENTLLTSYVAELESALDAATAAHQKKEAELALKIEGLEKRIEDSILKFRIQETELADLRSQSLAIVNAKPVKPPRTKSPSCLMSESPYALVAPFREALAKSDYAHADLNYYHEAIYNWSLSKGEKRIDWIAAAKGWLLRDYKKNELKLNPNSQLITTEHDKQQQSARNTKLGLVDTVALAESLAFCKSLGI